MYKRTLLSLAVASSITLTGCIGSVESGDDEAAQNPNPQGLTWPIFNPGAGAVPLPSDLNFRSDNPATTDISEADGSFSVTDSAPPVTTALNQLSGASTVAPPVVRLNGQIDADSVDSRAFVLADPGQPPGPGNIIPNPNQNVFLIELEYASGDPVLGLSAGEIPTASLGLLLTQAQGGDLDAAAEIGARFANPDYEAEVVTLDGTSAIRINPTKPLNPFKRYLVVVTNEVLDVNGDPIAQSPTYEYLSGEALVTAPLRAVQTLINSFWEPTAAGFFAGITNAARPTGLTVDDIALSYSFTTSNDEKVLSYILDPAAYLTDTIRGQARLAGVRSALAADQTAYLDLLAAASDGEDALIAESAPATTIEQIAGGAAAAIAGNLPPGTTLPVPADRGASATGTFDVQDVTQVSAVAAQFVEFGEVDAYQGTITTPYYLGIPTTIGGSDAEGSVINSESWKADATIAGVASTVLELDAALAQSDPTVSTVVNYRFALPDLVEEIDIPVLILRPADHTAANPTIIYQHGITTDRSTALTFGSALANATGAAVVAIDHPLHGVTPFSSATQRGLAEQFLDAGQDSTPPLPPSLAATEANIDAVIAGQLAIGFTATATSQNPSDAAATVTSVVGGGTTGDPSLDGAIRALRSFENTVANAGSTVPGLAKTSNERHFDYTANAANAPTAMTSMAGESGSLFINLNNFTNTRDKNRQSILDLVNLRMSLGSIDLDGGGADLNGSDVYFVGHSLGTIVGIPFVSIVNESATSADDIVAASMLTPGGGIVRLLENSPSFAPRILGGLQAASGLEQGDANLELFLNVNQAAVDSADPVNFVDNIIASGSPIALHQVNGDLVIPNSDDETYADPTPLVDNAFDAPLAGSEPLARLLGATSVNTANNPVSLNPASITRYLAGTHSTPVLPQGGDLDERVFAEMVAQTASILGSDPLSPTITQEFGGGDPDITEIVEQ